MPRYVDPDSKAATLIGSLVDRTVADPGTPARFPGGVYRGDARSDRKPGAFLVASAEAFGQEAVYTSKNRIEVRTLTVACYAEAASDAAALGEWLRPSLFDPRAWVLDGASVIGVVQDDHVVEETTDFAPKGGSRLHKAQFVLRAWISFVAR